MFLDTSSGQKVKNDWEEKWHKNVDVENEQNKIKNCERISGGNDNENIMYTRKAKVGKRNENTK